MYIQNPFFHEGGTKNSVNMWKSRIFTEFSKFFNGNNHFNLSEKHNFESSCRIHWIVWQVED